MESDALAIAVRAFIDELNSDDPEAVQHHIARDFYTYEPGPDEPTATETWAGMVADLRAAFPDLRVQIVNLEPAEGGRLIGTVTVTGTHAGPLWGAPPSGASVRWQPDVTVRPANGTFAVNFEGVSTPDLLAIFRQLEMVNPPDEMDRPPKHPDSVVPDFLLRMAFNGQVADRPCSHLDTAQYFDTDVTVCEQCVASGDIWPSLRMCVACGFVGCCDTSRNTHMKRHAEETGHVLMRSIRLDEGWLWCYADNAFFDSRMLERLRARAVGGG